MPHSEISGSKPVNDSPKLIAACHVLLRLPMPRHPPLALSSLSIKLDQTNIRTQLTVTFVPRGDPLTVRWQATNPPVHRIVSVQRIFNFSTIQLSKINFFTPRTNVLRNGFNTIEAITQLIHSRRRRHTILSSVLWFLTSDVVEVNGIEPMASCVQGRRSPS